jgi:hypothetical protein
MFSSILLKCYLHSYSQKAQVITSLFLPFLAVTNTNIFLIKYVFLHYLGFYLLIPHTQFNNEEFFFNHISAFILHIWSFVFLKALLTLMSSSISSFIAFYHFISFMTSSKFTSHNIQIEKNEC